MFKIKLIKKEMGSIIVESDAIENNSQKVYSLLRSVTSDLTKNHVVCTEVSKADIEHIYSLINDNAIHLTILLTNENSEKRVDGDFIDLRE